MLDITNHIRIPRQELHFAFARAGGPGGQNVNKVSSKVLLRWNPAQSPSLPEDVKSRLIAQQAGRLTRDGDLLLVSQRFRDQARNLDDCLNKLRDLILQALRPPKVRKATRPTKASREHRLEAKRRRAQTKARRQGPAENH